MRRLLSGLILPLAIVAGALASLPWLRLFPASSLAVALFGAAVLSVLLPVVFVQLVNRSLLISALADLLALVVYLLVIVLHDATGFAALIDGVRHGPAQILTFALPLVSPDSLMVVPVALCWLSGAIAGEALVRTEYSVLPYGGWLVTFVTAYAASARATVSWEHGAVASDALLAGALLVTFGLLRVAQAWVRADESAESTQPDGVLPVRGVVVGAVVTALVTLLAATAAHAPAFGGRPAVLQRVPAVDQGAPLTPLAFVSGMRPTSTRTRPTDVFDVALDAPSPGYFSVASVDFYDGDGWTFDRSFRPSGGVVPGDLDPSLRVAAAPVGQRYTVRNGPLSTGPWMPYVNRPVKVSGTPISVDPGTGMIVPSDPLRPGETYRVSSSTASRTLDQLPVTSLIATSAPPIDSQVPPSTVTALAKVVTALAAESGRTRSPSPGFLQAVARDLRNEYALTGPAEPSAAPAHPTVNSSGPAAPTTANPQSRAASTSFADVLASVLGPARAGTPEQFATLFALVSRSIGVPARVVTGFRVRPPSGSATLPSGQYTVTTAEAWTWVEIPVRDAGWVVVDPTPTRRAGGDQQQSVGAAPSTRASAVPTQNALVTQSAPGGNAVAPKSQLPADNSARVAWLPILGGVVLALLLLGLVLLRIRRVLVRRRRRRAPDPRDRLLGAWEESLAVLADAGLPDLSVLTSNEIVAATEERFGPEQAGSAAAIGYAADVALFSSTIPVRDGDADRAWAHHRDLRRGVRSQLPRSRRLAGTLGLRVPVRRH